MTAIWETGMDIQIAFAEPGMLTQSLVDPDELVVNITRCDLFKSKDGSSTLDSDSALLRVFIPLQFETERLEEQEWI